ncbi:MAG: peroxide stress protein YaaA [Bacteroidia bacterium]
MISILSPAKTLDYSTAPTTESYSQPVFQDETNMLAKQLAGMKPKKLATLMHLSDKLANLNFERYQEFGFPFTKENAKQALLAFKGDVYQGMSVDDYVSEDFDFAQNHLRILSGLYGLLRPLDLMQAYRLEMGTKMKNKRGKDLYAFWGSKIAQKLNEDIASSGSRVLVNLASQEYFKAVDTEALEAALVTPHFKEYRDGKLKIIALFAKKARGMMADYIIKNRINEVESIKDFGIDGYRFDEAHSTETNWVFSRR